MAIIAHTLRCAAIFTDIIPIVRICSNSFLALIDDPGDRVTAEPLAFLLGVIGRKVAPAVHLRGLLLGRGLWARLEEQIVLIDAHKHGDRLKIKVSTERQRDTIEELLVQRSQNFVL